MQCRFRGGRDPGRGWREHHGWLHHQAVQNAVQKDAAVFAGVPHPGRNMRTDHDRSLSGCSVCGRHTAVWRI